jgi:ectoine hydroxylase-related dioxygenase (phytanoyl-CoA dioxygenase family)
VKYFNLRSALSLTLMFPQITPKTYHYQDLTSIRNAFHNDGYVVVSDLPISSDEIKLKFIQDLKKIIPVPVDITLGNMWSLKESRDYPGSRMQGLLGEYGLSQGDAAWSVRTNPGIQSVFQSLLGESNLVCSTDAIGFSTDHEVATNAKWLHTDQNRLIPGCDILSIQSIFYAEDVPEDPEGVYACTVVVPGSHLEEITDPSYRSHFCMVDRESAYYNRAVRLRMKQGQLLLFNSYLVHQGWHGSHRLCFMYPMG